MTEEAKPSTQARAAALRPDQPAARGQLALRLLGADDALDRPGALREAQGAHLSADRQPRPARGLRRGRARQTIEMIAKETLPGPLRPLAVHAKTALKEGYVKPSKKIFDNAKVSDHFAIIPTLLPPKSLSEIEAKLYDMVAKRFLAVFFPPAEFMVTTRISTVAKARQGVPVPDQRQGHGQAGLARGLRPRGAGGRRQPGRRRQGRAGAHRERRRQGAQDQAAGALHRGDAALGDGRRRQADRRRRAARGDAGKGPRHAGDARRDHRRADLREVHPPRRAASSCPARRRSS